MEGEGGARGRASSPRCPSLRARGGGAGRWRRAPPCGGSAAAARARLCAGPSVCLSVRTAGIPSGDRGREHVRLGPSSWYRTGARCPLASPPQAPPRPGPVCPVNALLLSTAPKNPSSTAGLILEATATQSAGFCHFALAHLSYRHHLLGLQCLGAGSCGSFGFNISSM